MNDLGTLLGWISFCLLGMWRLYWYLSEQKTEHVKPKEKKSTKLFSKGTFSMLFTMFAFGVVGVQLLGISLFTMPNPNPFMQVLGFMFVLIGLGVAIVGRHNLGSNWANCYEYQVKQKQELVVHGIYKYIRHPLYAGIALFFLGSELIVQSYLVYVYLLGFVAANMQAAWEEDLLLKHFGTQYARYMKQTKRFIPYLW